MDDIAVNDKPAPTRHIVAIGGNLASCSAAAPAYMRYILNLTGRPKPRILFVPTATGDAVGDEVSFYRNLQGLVAQVSICRFFVDGAPRNWPPLANSYDAVYIGGGNTKSALAVFRDWEFDQALHQAWESGVVMAGSSAGALCWFQCGITDSWADAFTALNCMQFLPDACCPHYNVAGRREAFHQLLESGCVAKGYGIDECAAVHFDSGRGALALAAMPGRRVYAVSKSAGGIDEVPLSAASIT